MKTTITIPQRVGSNRGQMRTFLSLAKIIIGAVLGGILMVPAAGLADDDGIPRSLRGQIFMSSSPLSPPPDADAFAPYLQSQDTRTFKAGAEGDWTINFIAFFKGRIDNDNCHVVLYEKIDGKKNLVDYFTFNVDPGITTLSSYVTLTGARFTAGKKYELKVSTVNSAKKEQVLQTVMITLQ